MNTRRLAIRRLALAAAATLMVGATLPAAAQLVTLVDAVELSPRNIILPGSVNGMVTFRTCDDGCDEEYSRARLTPETRFYVGEQAVRFDDFRQDFAVIRTSKSSYALINVDIKTRTITSIQIQG